MADTLIPKSRKPTMLTPVLGTPVLQSLLVRRDAARQPYNQGAQPFTSCMLALPPQLLLGQLLKERCVEALPVAIPPRFAERIRLRVKAPPCAPNPSQQESLSGLGLPA